MWGVRQRIKIVLKFGTQFTEEYGGGYVMPRFLLLLSLLVSCGVEQACQSIGHRREPQPGDCTVEQISPAVHSKLQYAVELFSADAIRNEVPCTRTPRIGFMRELPPDTSKNVVGYCRPGLEVRALTSYWRSASATERLVLMYHELGHCALGLDHHDGEPDIMNSYLLDEITSEKKWEELVNKMMGRAR